MPIEQKYRIRLNWMNHSRFFFLFLLDLLPVDWFRFLYFNAYHTHSHTQRYSHCISFDYNKNFPRSNQSNPILCFVFLFSFDVFVLSIFSLPFKHLRRSWIFGFLIFWFIDEIFFGIFCFPFFICSTIAANCAPSGSKFRSFFFSWLCSFIFVNHHFRFVLFEIIYHYSILTYVKKKMLFLLVDCEHLQ